MLNLIGAADDSEKMVADQLSLAGVVAVRVGRVAISEPAAPAAGYVGDEGSFGASRDVGPGIAQGTVSVAASDVPMVDVCGVIKPRADASHRETMTTTVNEEQAVGHGWVTARCRWVCLGLWPRETV